MLTPKVAFLIRIDKPTNFSASSTTYTTCHLSCFSAGLLRNSVFKSRMTLESTDTLVDSGCLVTYSKTTCLPRKTNLGVRKAKSSSTIQVGSTSGSTSTTDRVNVSICVDFRIILWNHRDAQSANSTEFRAGKMVLPTSNANGLGRKGARNFNHASIPDIAKTKLNQTVERTVFVAAKSSWLGTITIPKRE